MVASNAKLDYKLDYLVVRTLDEVKRIHLSEIGVLMVESTAVSLTAYLLCELMRRKIKVIFCDHDRNPCAELVPVNGSPTAVLVFAVKLAGNGRCVSKYGRKS